MMEDIIIKAAIIILSDLNGDDDALAGSLATLFQPLFRDLRGIAAVSTLAISVFGIMPLTAFSLLA